MSFLGIGPGRCGTVSLSRMLNDCKQTWAFHEEYRAALPMIDIISAWERGKWPVDWQVGFIGLGWTRQWARMRFFLPDIRVICLHRPKQEVIESFGRTTIVRYDELEIMEPKIPEPKEVGEHWEDCEAIMAEVTPPVLHLQTRDLSDDGKITEVFEFIGIPKGRRVMPEKRVWNTRADQEKANKLLTEEMGKSPEVGSMRPGVNST